MATRAFALIALAAALTFTGCQSTRNSARTAAPAPVAAPAAAPDVVVITDEIRATLRHAETLVDEVGFTPGRENALRVNNPNSVKFRKELMESDTYANRAHFNYMYGDITRAIENGLKGKDFPAPPEARLPRAAGPILCDGKLDDAGWASAAVVTGAYPFGTTDLVTDPATTFRTCWDDQYLYFAFDCRDTDIVAETRERDGHIYFDDCVEMYILPTLRHRLYWEIDISPIGSIYDSLQSKQMDQWGATQDTSVNVDGIQLGISVDGSIADSSDTDRGYIMEIAIPWNQIPEYSRAAPAPGHTIRFLMIRLDVNSLPGQTKPDGSPKTKMTPYAHIPIMAWGHNIWSQPLWTLEK